MITYGCGHTIDDPREIRHTQICIRCWYALRNTTQDRDIEVPELPGVWTDFRHTITDEDVREDAGA